jgi:hypothetical protein
MSSELSEDKSGIDNMAISQASRQDTHLYHLWVVSHNYQCPRYRPEQANMTLTGPCLRPHIRDFSIRFGLMVGIGRGVPSKETDIRLGDIVVSKPTKSSGGVVQYDYGTAIREDHFERTSALNKPPQALLTAVAILQADHMQDDSRIPTFLSEMMAKRPAKFFNFTHRGQQQDRLFRADYDHRVREYMRRLRRE